MATLDRGLRQAEALAGLLNKGRDRAAKAAKTSAQKAAQKTGKGSKRRRG
ncbi:MAG TPA: hypothetical protein VIG92_03285 [Rhodospirillales bacterium]